MAHIILHFKVEDYNKWKPVFDEYASFRSENGSKGGKIYRSADNPNEIFTLFDWDSAENAQKFAQSSALKEAMQKAGVLGKPEVHFLQEAITTSN